MKEGQQKEFTAGNFHSLCDELASGMPVFSTIIRQHGYPPMWSREPGFETLVHIILEQQVSLASALAAFQKLKSYLPVISPGAVLSLDDAQLKACYFSRQKILYVRDLARRVEDGKLNLSTLADLDDEAVLEKLTVVKGIGTWSATVYLMMAMHRPDCFPAGDMALMKSMENLLLLPASSHQQAILAVSGQWKPLRTIAAYLLWHAYLSAPVRKKPRKLIK